MKFLVKCFNAKQNTIATYEFNWNYYYFISIKEPEQKFPLP